MLLKQYKLSNIPTAKESKDSERLDTGSRRKNECVKMCKDV
jgi:hypothetical protein